MTEIEKRIIQNQIEIMWAINYILKKMMPDLVGRGGELDRMCDDLRHASNDSKKLLKND